MTIRKATAKDWPDVTRLIEAYPGSLMQKHLPQPKEFFVAVESGSVVACCALEIYSKRMAEVRSLAVAEQQQGKGIATKLVRACIGEARKKRIHEVLTITGVPSLFKKQGFGPFKKGKYALLKVLGK